MKPDTSILTHDYRECRSKLEDAGWRTSQTYCNLYEEPGDFPAVYVFLLVDWWEFKRALPAYVGMSTRLLQRWSGHEILRELEKTDFWVQRWFLRLDEVDLRSTEAAYIKKFNPPWNISGRPRGVSLS